MSNNKSGHPTAVPQFNYEATVDDTKTLIFSGKGNLYAFLAEDNSSANSYIQFFDAAAIGDVTLGTTSPDWTVRIPADGTMGKDSNDTPLKHFSLGCVVAVTTDRTNAVAGDATITFWSSKV